MTNYKTILQDVLNTILLFSLVGVALSASLQPLVSAKAYMIIIVVLGGLKQLVYYADVIFGFTNSPVSALPTTPVVTTTVSSPTTVTMS